MPDFSELNGLIKTLALEAVAADMPANLEYGTVNSVSPLIIQTDQRRTYTHEFLIVPAHLRDIEVETEITLPTDAATHTHDITPAPDENEETPEDTQEYEASEETHEHTVTGMVRFTIPFGLKVGDRVALLRKQGGCDYFILGVIP